MLNLFAHPGHSHDAVEFAHSTDFASTVANSMPIIIGAGIIILILIAAIIFLLLTWQPRPNINTQAKDE